MNVFRLSVAIVLMAGIALSRTILAAEDRSAADAAGQHRGVPLREVLRGNVAIDVRLERRGRIDTHNDLPPPGEALSFGLAAIPVSIIQSLINPFALLGAVVYPVATPIASQDFAAKDAAIRNVATTEDYATLLRDALRSELGVAPAAEYALVVEIHAYGLQSRTGKPVTVLERAGDLCLVTHATYTVRREGGELVRDSIDIGLVKRSAEAPVPLCANFARFAEDNGRYLRLAMRETADVLSAVILSRLGGQR